MVFLIARHVNVAVNGVGGVPETGVDQLHLDRVELQHDVRTSSPNSVHRAVNSIAKARHSNFKPSQDVGIDVALNTAYETVEVGQVALVLAQVRQKQDNALTNARMLRAAPHCVRRPGKALELRDERLVEGGHLIRTGRTHRKRWWWWWETRGGSSIREGCPQGAQTSGRKWRVVCWSSHP